MLPPMKLFGTSAFIFWRHAASAAGETCAKQSPRRYAKELCAACGRVFESGFSTGSSKGGIAALDADALAAACRDADGVLHGEVSRASARRANPYRGDGVFEHVRTASLSSSYWLRACFDYEVPVPELCFLQMAAQVPLLDLIALGMELVGAYSVVPNGDGKIVSRPPLATLASLESLLGKAGSVHGAKRARRALNFMAEGAASPQEARLYLLLCLPVKMGGYGLAPARLNARIDTNASGGVDPARRYRVCDLYWPDRQVAVEYDSDAFHVGADRIAADSIRRTALATKGIRVVTITNAQMKSNLLMNQAVSALCRELGVRKHRCSRDWDAERAGLRKVLFSDFL